MSETDGWITVIHSGSYAVAFIIATEKQNNLSIGCAGEFINFLCMVHKKFSNCMNRTYTIVRP